MPVREDVETVLVIGSGPIIIGQAAEFDYAGTQACKALREEGRRVVLVNSNPATIMTDEGVADVTYIEPLTVPVLRRVIEREAPDGLLATLGGQTGLNLAVELSNAGVLDEYHVKLLGTSLSTIRQAEDRELFKQLLLRLGIEVPPSQTVTTLEAALDFAGTIGMPVVVRPAFTLGGTGGGVAHSRAELARIAESGLAASPIGQILVEQYLRGWKEIEYEVLRDSSGTCITVCNMENFDPLGVHTGDSIVVAPSQTLSDREHQMLRSASLRIIRTLGVEGGCNIQFALDPHSLRFYVIEVNPRVSRSSALASKATGYPIARVAAKIAIGLRLDEIRNEITGMTVAAFEPALDYCVVKIPRWPFDKFPLADRRLGTQMKATGEVMAIDRTFEAALQKAMRSLELRPAARVAGPGPTPDPDLEVDREILELAPPGESQQAARQDSLWVANDARLGQLLDTLRAGDSETRLEELHSETGIDHWFLAKLRNIVEMERSLARGPLTRERLRAAKRMGFSDQRIEELSDSLPPASPDLDSADLDSRDLDSRDLDTSDPSSAVAGRKGMGIRALRRRWGILPTYKMVDTCAAEFPAQTPYFYSTYEEENEAAALPGARAVVLGSGPIRIGQGIEFDYCSVRAALELQSAGVKSILVNSNPETVSTDFDVSSRLYFEPLDVESVLNILENEAQQYKDSLPPVVTQFGGQTAIGLAADLAAYGAKLLGTGVDSIDLAEDRLRFDALMERLRVPRPQGAAVRTVPDALRTASNIGYPVLVRPSYVLGGRGMEIVRTEPELQRYMTQVVAEFGEHPILIDRYLSGREVEVDALCDGTDILIPGIMEHIERAGVHSGDSFAVYPARSLSLDEIARIAAYTRMIALALDVRGLVNVQFVLTAPDGHVTREGDGAAPDGSRVVPDGGEAAAPPSNVYVLEVNPRASRTVPFLSKVTGVPMVSLATRITLGESLRQLGYAGLPDGLWPAPPLVAVKGPVFSMAKITGGEMALSPEMKSTGEVLGVDKTYPAALTKALLAAHIDVPAQNGVAFVSLADRDKEESLPILRRLGAAGYSFYATPGTAAYLQAQGVEAAPVSRIRSGDDTILQLIRQHRVQLVLNTLTGGGGRLREGSEIRDGFEIRRTAVESGVTCLTSLDTARAVVEALYNSTGYSVLPIGDYRRRD